MVLEWHPPLEASSGLPCKMRWERKKKNSLRGNWSDDEDKALAAAVAGHINVRGRIDWKEVQEALRSVLPRRTR